MYERKGKKGLGWPENFVSYKRRHRGGTAVLKEKEVEEKQLKRGKGSAQGQRGTKNPFTVRNKYSVKKNEGFWLQHPQSLTIQGC